MKATEVDFLGFLKKSTQFLVPIYQRNYSWTNKECTQLWDDIWRAGSDDAIKVHFIGSVVYIEEGLSQVSHHSPHLVIDGQQRLTTVTLLLTALAEALGDEEPIDGFSARKIRHYYLLNSEETGNRHYKLLLSETDRDTLIALIGGEELPAEPSLRIVQSYRLFKNLIDRHRENLEIVCKGLSKLVLVDIALNRSNDNPQLIFESMNSTGRKLSQSDLIRNFVLMNLPPKIQTKLYKEFWRQMETEFGQEAYDEHFNKFMRHYLTVKTREIPRLHEVYDTFKSYTRENTENDTEVETLIREVRNYARHYCAMALGRITDPDLKPVFDDLRELKTDVPYPLLLELYYDYAEGILLKKDLIQAVRLVESYIFRRTICSIPTSSLNKTFASFTLALKKDRYLESIQAHFLLLRSYRRFPNDDEFVREFQKRDTYNFRNRSYWLRRFENHGRKERVTVGEYTIEHIMPQELTHRWKNALGPEWERIHGTYLHTLGNLTLTGYNSEYSNSSFSEKRDMSKGFKDSPLLINESLRQVQDWNERAIRDRAEQLAERAPGIWIAPHLTQEVLESYRPKTESRTSYSIEDHRNLNIPTIHKLFEAFRKEVLALDPCVKEEFLKLYVAYKAETNFVDVAPQTNLLLLTLNIKFPDLLDPKGICRDRTGYKSGRGNGEVELKLRTLDELPYVLGLVRQSLEQQLGDSNDE